MVPPVRAVASSLLTTFAGAAVVVAVSGATGCAAVSDGMQEKLYDATRAYNRSLRWEDYDRAAAFVPAESENAFLDEHQDLADQYVMLDYQLTRLQIDKLKGVAYSRVELQWHADRELSVEKTSVDQVWQWYEGRWWLVEEWRASGEPMPLFADRDESEDSEDRDDEDDSGDPDRDDEDEGRDTDAADGPPQHPYLPGLKKFREVYEIGEENEEPRPGHRRRDAAHARQEPASPQGRSLPIGVNLSEG